MTLRLRLFIEWLGIGIVASLLVLFANQWDGTRSFDNLLYDQLSGAARTNADQNTLLVNIDDASLKQLGKWPWPRQIHADLIENLQRQTPRSIAFDVILSEPSDPISDKALAKAMAGPSPVILPVHFPAPGADGRNYDIALPAQAFANAARATGHVNLTIDEDNVVRRTELCFDPEGDGNSWPHLMEQVYRVDEPSGSRVYRKGSCGKSLLIPYAKRGSHAEISYADLLNNDVPAALVAGRDIIIGATATGLGDRYPVPYGDGGTLAGSEIMANVLRAIKQDSFITRVPASMADVLSLLPLWMLMTGFLAWSPRTALAASLLLMATILVGTAAALHWLFWFPPGSALLGILIVYPLWGWRRLQAMSDFMGLELRRLEHGGEVIPVSVRQVAAGDLVGRQSTALARAIDHMKDLRRFVSDTLADLPDPMLVTDLSGKILLENDLARQRLRGSIVGMSISKVAENAAIPEHRGPVSDFILGRDPSAANSIRFDTVENDTYVMRKSLLEDSAGQLQGYIYYLADITALAAAETERERVLQLLSHDMRAPQAAIISSLSGRIDQKVRQRIERNARRTIQLAQDFVDLARMSESVFSGDDILLADLIRDVADSYWPLAKERNIIVEINDDSDAGFVNAEADGLTRAFANLVDNAIKFSPDGGTIAVNVSRIDHGGLPFLSVKISDQGAGIAADIQPNLFRRFVTGGTPHGRVKGTGLGLTYVMTVVARHGGKVSGINYAHGGGHAGAHAGVNGGANASSGGGACFEVLLPEAVEEENG